MSRWPVPSGRHTPVAPRRPLRPAGLHTRGRHRIPVLAGRRLALPKRARRARAVPQSARRASCRSPNDTLIVRVSDALAQPCLGGRFRFLFSLSVYFFLIFLV